MSLPTDCPQRDERLGWTGDAQAFAATGATLLDSYAFWQSWLRDLELDQDDVLGVPSVVPDIVLEGPARFGRAGWADAATIVPWAVYESYGDRDILVRQLDSMRRWMRSLEARQQPSGLLEPGMQLGDWLDPDAPAERPWLAKADSEFIANAFFAHSARLLARTAAIVGDEATAPWAAALGDRVAAATWRGWRDTAPGTQTGCALLLCMDIAPAAERPAVGQALADLVNDADGRVATGFLGTPFVLPALAETGHLDEAYRMLLRHGPAVVAVPGGTWARPPSGSAGTRSGRTARSTRARCTRSGIARGHPRRAHALVQPLRVRRRHRLGLPPPGGARPRQPAARVPPHEVRRRRLSTGCLWARARVASAYGDVAIAWEIDDTGLFSARVGLPERHVRRVPAAGFGGVGGDARRRPDRRTGALRIGAGEHLITVSSPVLLRVPGGRDRMPRRPSPESPLMTELSTGCCGDPRGARPGDSVGRDRRVRGRHPDARRGRVAGRRDPARR